jgi:uncharacterized protein (TIGR03663 family)
MNPVRHSEDKEIAISKEKTCQYPYMSNGMKWSKKCCFLILAATIAAIALRLPLLEQRPMHGDEAVHAEKFRLLLEEDFYRYDRYEYHGPTLNYLTLIPAWLSSAEKLTEINEFTLRIVPVFFGVLLVLLLLLIVDGLGRTVAVCAAILTAVSPAMVFYSRYYIQEMLLVCFTFGVITCGYRYTQSKNIAWALLTGVFLGLAHATKETFIIAFDSMLLALVLTLLLQSRRDGSSGFIKTLRKIKPSHFIAVVAAAVVVSALFYSSFFTNPNGIVDSVRTYATYFRRASQNQWHIHPWYYYLKILIYSRYGAGPLWTEALIVLLAIVGFIVAMTRKGLSGVDFHLLRFIGFYTLITTVVYSVIRYKTPWCLSGFLHGMILLAGVGAVALVRLAPNVLARVLIGLLLVAGGAHLTWQGYLGSYKFYADSRSPYVYAHPTTDVFTVVQRVKEMARAHPDGLKMHIQVICPEGDYWPLPWYFRSFTKVGWWNKVPDDVLPAPLIIASAKVEEALANKIYVDTPLEERQMYLFLFDKPYYMWLRPKVKLLGFVRKDLWDRLQKPPDAADSITDDR